MSEAAAVDAVPVKPRGGAKGLLFGIVAALALGGGGFWAIYSGMIDPAKLMGGGGEHGGGGGGHGEAGSEAAAAFVAMDPITISLPPQASARHLRFTGQIEVEPGQAVAVAAVMPRILDVLNTYLRAVEVRDLEEPAALPRLRAQMLRRVQVVTGEGMVRDLLITEFVLN
ncbi:MAG: flagellar basal body-associated FliL family protein [Amaricoccus sp.]